MTPDVTASSKALERLKKLQKYWQQYLQFVWIPFILMTRFFYKLLDVDCINIKASTVKNLGTDRKTYKYLTNLVQKYILDISYELLNIQLQGSQ